MPHPSISGLKKRDPVAYSDMFDTYFQGLLVFASNMVFREDAAYDIVQDIFVSVYENTASFADSRSLRSYLYKSVRNRCYNYLRDRRIEDRRLMLYAEAALVSDSAGGIVDEEEMLRLVAEFLEELPGQCREVCRMRLFEGRSFGEIAAGLGISENTARVQLHRGVRKMSEHFGRNGVVMTFVMASAFFG